MEKKKDLMEHHLFEDPQAHCYLSGVLRQMYTPFGFQILQPAGHVVLLYEAFHSYRNIPVANRPLDNRPHIPDAMRLFEGDSRGHWEGDTLVVDVTNQNPRDLVRYGGKLSQRCASRGGAIHDERLEYNSL
jgi:hypothetical protein